MKTTAKTGGHVQFAQSLVLFDKHHKLEKYVNIDNAINVFMVRILTLERRMKKLNRIFTDNRHINSFGSQIKKCSCYCHQNMAYTQIIEPEMG